MKKGSKHTPEAIAKMKKNHTGLKHSDETKKAIAESLIRRNNIITIQQFYIKKELLESENGEICANN